MRNIYGQPTMKWAARKLPIALSRANGRLVAAMVLAARHRWTFVFFELPLSHSI
jgi:hypothetical protein